MLSRMYHYTARRYVCVYQKNGSIVVDTVNNRKIADMLYEKYSRICIIDAEEGFLYKIKGSGMALEHLLLRVSQIRALIRA